MRLIPAAIIASVVMTTAPLAMAQTPTPRMQPAAPGSAGDPAWQAKLQLSDGRMFVTDGGLIVEAALAKPSSLPERTVPPKALEDYFKAPHTSEHRLSDLSASGDGRRYTTPEGIPLSSTYVTFLRRVAPRSARLRLAGPTRPVVVVDGSTPIAVLMPMAVAR